MSQSSGGSVLPLHNTIQRIPAARDFPSYPASWYLLCASREVNRVALKKLIFGRELLLFRGASGKVVAMDNRCAHLGADLSQGRIAGDNIICPFHGWRYDASGRCVQIPGEAAIPPFARQIVYPIEERHGLVFIFNGPQVLFPLPFFTGEKAGNFVAAQAAEFIAETSWYMVAAHGYDLHILRQSMDGGWSRLWRSIARHPSRGAAGTVPKSPVRIPMIDCCVTS